MKSNYCPYVYKGLRISFAELDNKFYMTTKPCCHVDTDEFPYNLQEYDINKLLTSDNMLYFKDYFDKNDNLPPACISCIKQEAAHQKSYRTRAIENSLNEYDIYKFDIVIGHTCNLACPFCSSYASSLINVLSKKHKGEDLPEMWIPRSEKHDPTQTNIISAIYDVLSQYKCQSIKVIGGEPFLKEHWQVFEDLLEKGFLINSTLEITTNGTIMNQKILDSLSKTKKTIIRASIDSIDKNYEFIRWPFTFEKIFNNMKFLSDNKTDNIKIELSCLVNIINFEYLPDIEEFLYPHQGFNLGFETLIKPAGQSMDWRYLSKEIVDDVCSKLKNKRLVKLIQNESLFINTDKTTKTLKFLLKQRNMSAEEVFKPATREYLKL